MAFFDKYEILLLIVSEEYIHVSFEITKNISYFCKNSSNDKIYSGNILIILKNYFKIQLIVVIFHYIKTKSPLKELNLCFSPYEDDAFTTRPKGLLNI